QLKQWVPQVRVVGNDDSGISAAEAMQLFQGRLAIIKDAHRIDDKNEVECSLDSIENIFRFAVTGVKHQMRIFAPRFQDHVGANVDADALTRFQSCKRIACTAADLENRTPFRNQETQISLIFSIKKCCFLPPPLTQSSPMFGMIHELPFSC